MSSSTTSYNDSVVGRFFRRLTGANARRKETDLTRKLKKQHAALLEGLQQVQQLGVTTPEAKRKLFKIKELLLEHLRIEDQHLYPALRHSEDPAARLTAEMFDKEMAEISKDVVAFFHRYEEDSHGLDFTRDLAHVIITLRKRVDAEETKLYPAYDNYGVNPKQ